MVFWPYHLYSNQKVELRPSVQTPHMQFTSQSGSILGININVQSQATHQKGYLLYSHSGPHTSLKLLTPPKIPFSKVRAADLEICIQMCQISQRTAT